MRKGGKIFSLPVIPLIIAIFCSVLVFLLVSSIYRESPVFDEIAFTTSGYVFLTQHDFRADPFNPPFTRELEALPMLFDKQAYSNKVFLLPRLVVVFFTVCLGIVVYLFAKKFYGVKAGLFALLLFIFEPEILAHGHYAMTDLILTFFFTLSLFLYILFWQAFGYIKLLLFSIVVGFSLAAKFTVLPYLFTSLGALFLIEKKKKQTLFKPAYLKQQNPNLLVFFLFFSFSILSTHFF